MTPKDPRITAALGLKIRNLAITLGETFVTPVLHKTSPFVATAQTATGASSEPTRSTCIEMSSSESGPISSHGPVVKILLCLQVSETCTNGLFKKKKKNSNAKKDKKKKELLLPHPSPSPHVTSQSGFGSERSENKNRRGRWIQHRGVQTSFINWRANHN